LFRVHQYVKNIFVLAPLFFVGEMGDLDKLQLALLAFLGFCFASSAVYILNDYLDVEEDRKHPVKRYRPLASGDISKRIAVVLMLLLWPMALLVAWVSSASVLWIVSCYMILNVLYSVKLKHIALIDVSIIATGFVLRLFAGAYAAQVELSAWIVMMTFLLALFMAFAKRRDDLVIYERTGKKMRKAVEGYNTRFLDVAIAIMASVIIVSYIGYTMSVGGKGVTPFNSLYLTTIFVVFGVLRYLQLTLVYEDSGSPTKILLKDRMTQFIVSAWIITFLVTIYF
jgi:4-hydroxybenzoate polyprenyltransferase